MGIEVFLTAIIIGLIPAFIASGKGRNFFLWWLYGASLFIVAIFHAILIKPTEKKLLSEGMPDILPRLKPVGFRRTLWLIRSWFYSSQLLRAGLCSLSERPLFTA